MTPNYVTAGAGPGLLFIHGAGGNAAVWHHQMAAFANTHRVLALDLPGFGRTPPIAPERFAESLAGAPAAVLDAAGLERTSLVCQSLGGWFGLRLALERPERVERLVLSCTMASVAHPPALASFQAAMPLMGARGPASLALPQSFIAAQPAAAYLYEQINAFSPPLDPALGGLAFAPDTLIPVERLQAVRRPVLILAGALDPIWPPAALEGLVSAFPDARMHVFEDCGHSPYVEAPDAFNAAVAAFLA